MVLHRLPAGSQRQLLAAPSERDHPPVVESGLVQGLHAEHFAPFVLATVRRKTSLEHPKGGQASRLPGLPARTFEAEVPRLDGAVCPASSAKEARAPVDVGNHEPMPLRLDNDFPHGRNVTWALFPPPPAHSVVREGNRQTPSTLPSLALRHPAMLRWDDLAMS